MVTTFNPNRKTGGTIELVRDSNGNYSTKEVGFNEIGNLSIPDFKTTTTTTTTTDTKTAAEITGDTIDTQTQMAFQTPERSNDNQIDTTGEMLQESAKQLSDSLQTVSTPNTIQDSMVRSNRLSAEQAAPQENILDTPEIKNPTERVFRSDTARFKQEFDPTRLDSTLAIDKDLKGSAAVQRGDIEPPGFNFDFLKGRRFKGGDGSTTRAAKEADFASGRIGSNTSATRAAKEADFASGKLGITETKPLDTARFEGVSRMGALAGDEKKDVKPIKRNALETVSTSLRTTKDSILSKIKTPGMMIIDAISDATLSPQQKNRNAFNANYFNVRDDGRISGNPAKDVFAGMNRESAFGDVGKSARDRISTREKTIERKGYKAGDKFYDDTQNMKSQVNDYQGEKNKSDLAKGPGALGPAGGATNDGGSSGGGKIVCTMMNESYGFGSFRNKIWLRHSKNLAPEYQIGYHRIFLPLVKKAKTNKILKKILEHIAIHRTIDIRQEERNKIHLLGRAYRTILEPICYWVGKI